MVNKYLNNLLVQMDKIIGCETGVIESSGNVVSSGPAEGVAQRVPEIFEQCLESRRRNARIDGYTYYAVITRGKPDYVCFVKCDDENSEKYRYFSAGADAL